MSFKFIERYRVLRGLVHRDVVLGEYPTKDIAIACVRTWLTSKYDDGVRVELVRYASVENLGRKLNYDSTGVWNSAFDD